MKKALQVGVLGLALTYFTNCATVPVMNSPHSDSLKKNKRLEYVLRNHDTSNFPKEYSWVNRISKKFAPDDRKRIIMAM